MMPEGLPRRSATPQICRPESRNIYLIKYVKPFHLHCYSRTNVSPAARQPFRSPIPPAPSIP